MVVCEVVKVDIQLDAGEALDRAEPRLLFGQQLGSLLSSLRHFLWCGVLCVVRQLCRRMKFWLVDLAGPLSVVGPLPGFWNKPREANAQSAVSREQFFFRT